MIYGYHRTSTREQHYGRPQIGKPDNWDQVMDEWHSGRITAVEAMRKTGLKKSTFYRLVKE